MQSKQIIKTQFKSNECPNSFKQLKSQQPNDQNKIYSLTLHLNHKKNP